MQRAILHVDMDAFYASVEIRERPELATRPVVVGGLGGRGVVSAANYIARRYGVHSAMPMVTALRLCPEAVCLPPRHDFYARVSQQIRAVFERYTPLVEPLSLDEAFLDVTASLKLFGPADGIARAIKQAIHDELNLIASVGLAPNKFLAKIASDIDKPNGFRVVAPDEVHAFLDPLPVSRLWGVGKVTVKAFERLGIRTVGQFRRYSPALVRAHFGNAGEHLLQLAQGIDHRPVEPEQAAKSISHETTFARDQEDRELLHAALLELTDQVASRLRAHGLRGRTVQLKVRFADFTTITRSHSLAQPSDVTEVLWRTVRELFDTRLPSRPLSVRLIGMGVSGFGVEGPAQAELLEPETERSAQVDAVTDAIRARFGHASVQRGGGRRRS